MTPGSRPHRAFAWRLSSVLGVIAVWTVLGLLSAGGTAVTYRELGRAVAWPALLTERLVDWYTCAAFTPLFVWLARRWTLEARGWVTRVPAWLAVTTMAIPLKYALYRSAVGALQPEYPMRPLAGMVTINFVGESLAFWAMIAVIYAVEYYDGIRQREIQAATLKAELAEARLDALGAQLHPHFLFNTLQGISTLLYRDAAAADRMLTRLSSLLRRALDRSDPEVTLAEEMEMVAEYAEIQRTRFGDRLVVDQAVSVTLAGALVPRFILQPLVENAIRHGISRRAEAGRIRIAAARENGHLVLSVADNGPGPGANRTQRAEGTGLSNTRRRLTALYGELGTVALSEPPEGGTLVTVALPYRTTT